MKAKLGLVIAVLFAVGILASPAFCQDQPAQKTTQDTVANNTTSDTAVSATGGTPHIFYPDSIYNFGDVAQRQSLTHVFKVQNTGDGVLKLINARAS